MPEIGTYSLSGGRRLARQRASSDPTDAPYNRRLAQFQDRVASSRPEDRATKMENKINQAVRGTPEPCVLHRRKGLEVKQLFSPLPVEGEVFFLTFPFIEQAITRFDPANRDFDRNRELSLVEEGRSSGVN
jgi:hypothetical protein